ncbi:MAG: Vitamin B12 dependent methionine synthase activation subunit [Clostridia bacterium]|nr:Vitamin B12 dependent methionine synthase activation subunit [Clostridia bacterium]
MTYVQTFDPPPVCKKEILRYAGCKTESDLPQGLLESSLDEAKNLLTYKVCYTSLDIKITGENCDFGLFSVKSGALAKNLAKAEKAVLFAATVGVGIDRLIEKYGAVSPAKAVLFQAIGAERIEALCDTFCTEVQSKTGLYVLPRFSPGYGDFALQSQKDIFSLLNCRKLIGLTLNDSLIMSPSKSVTAIAGLTKKPQDGGFDKCRVCKNTDCVYRGV